MPAIRVSRAAASTSASRKDFFRLYTFGLAVQNIGSVDDRALRHRDAQSPPGTASRRPGVAELHRLQLTSARLPLRTTLGVADAAQPSANSISSRPPRSRRFAPDGSAASGGAEVGYSWLDGYSIALRAGARRPLPGEAPFTGRRRLQHGSTFDRLRASRRSPGSRFGHRIGLRIR